MPAWITEARREFHKTIIDELVSVNADGVPSNADKGSAPSIAIAKGILGAIGTARTADKLPGQTAGANFEVICARFIELSFSKLSHLRPGTFLIEMGGAISKFDQYSHLDELEAIAKQNRVLATALGSDYLIKPDIVIARLPESDEAINKPCAVVDVDAARLTSLRSVNQTSPILHASISCKWTLRSDRAQNARSEGLNLVRNRKGRLPHIAVITAEPTPGRIASLALGTGDIDCVYHFALPELRRTLQDQGRTESCDLLDTMVQGKRLRDIADLPLDLTI